MSETKKVICTRPVYRGGVYYEAGKTLTVGAAEKCKGWRDVDAPAAAAAPVAPKAPAAPVALDPKAKRPSDKDL